MAFIKTEKDLERVPDCYKILNCEKLKLVEFPKKSIFHLSPYLKSLHLANNEISEIPNYVFKKLKHLYWLDLRWNKISKIPDSVSGHPNLTTVLLQNNEINILNPAILTCTKLMHLKMSGNPLKKPPWNIFNHGIEGLRNFYSVDLNNNNNKNGFVYSTLLINKHGDMFSSSVIKLAFM